MQKLVLKNKGVFLVSLETMYLQNFFGVSCMFQIFTILSQKFIHILRKNENYGIRKISQVQVR